MDGRRSDRGGAEVGKGVSGVDTQVIVAVFAFSGTLVGTIAGIIAATKITNYRLEQLEKRMDKHNELIERIYVLSEKLENAVNRITGLERRE